MTATNPELPEAPLDDLARWAERLRHVGVELVKLAADVEATVRRERHDLVVQLPFYQPRFEVEDGIEAITERFACCGAGVDQRDVRTGERLHFPGCPKIAADGLASCRDRLAS